MSYLWITNTFAFECKILFFWYTKELINNIEKNWKSKKFIELKTLLMCKTLLKNINNLIKIYLIKISITILKQKDNKV